jgi:Tetracyclin repressor-like, C-terminal domain
VLERVIDPVLEVLSEPAAALAEPARVVDLVMGLLARHPNLARLVEHEILTGGERLSPLLRDRLAPVLEGARGAIAASPAAASWRPEQVPLLALALYHVAVGYFAMAPVYRELFGEDLLSDAALARQTRFFSDLVARLLPDDAASR